MRAKTACPLPDHMYVRLSITVSIPRSHRGDPGPIPGVGVFFFIPALDFLILLKITDVSNGAFHPHGTQLLPLA